MLHPFFKLCPLDLFPHGPFYLEPSPLLPRGLPGSPEIRLAQYRAGTRTRDLCIWSLIYYQCGLGKLLRVPKSLCFSPRWTNGLCLTILWRFSDINVGHLQGTGQARSAPEPLSPRVKFPSPSLMLGAYFACPSLTPILQTLSWVIVPSVCLCCSHEIMGRLFEIQEDADLFLCPPLSLPHSKPSVLLMELQKCYQRALLNLTALWHRPVTNTQGWFVERGKPSQGGVKWVNHEAQAFQNSFRGSLPKRPSFTMSTLDEFFF